MALTEEVRFRVGCRFPELRELLALLPVAYSPKVRRFSLGRDGFLCGESVVWEDYVHVLIHRLCDHPAGAEDHFSSVWNLACDMAAEVIRLLMFPEPNGEDLLRDVRAVLTDGGDPWNAEDLYRSLMNLYEEELEELSARFTRDDHRFWVRGGETKNEIFTPLFAKERAEIDAAQEKDRAIRREAMRDEAAMDKKVHEMLVSLWMPLLSALTGGEETGKRFGIGSGSIEERVLLRERNRLDFSRYLRRFATFGEEVRTDEDSFDQIPYTYGLARYGNLPLVEPLEYSDCYRVEDLVIAIDTSGSCSVELVRDFLGEIRHILMDHDAFFRRMNVHILQCDAYVRDHAVIRSREDWDRYSREIVIKGRRGTDFRPVFHEVDRSIREKEFKRLKGLFYFTDGEGIYPEKKPDYETAFVYSTAKALEKPGIPDWVTRLCMELPKIGG